MPGVAEFDEPSRGRSAARAQAYAETFAGQCARTVQPMLDAFRVPPGTELLDIGTADGAIAGA